MNKEKTIKDLNNEEIYEVECLRAHRLSARDDNKSYEYLVKWKDYSEEHNTWERERNIYSKGLITAYWRKQNTTNETSNETNKYEPITSAKLSPKPPEGKTWNDIESVENVYYCGDTIIMAEIKWKDNEQHNTFIPTRIIRQKTPLKLIEYYQKKIEYIL